MASGAVGSSARGYGPSNGGSGLSGEAYRRKHEITVTVSIECVSEFYFMVLLYMSFCFRCSLVVLEL